MAQGITPRARPSMRDIKKDPDGAIRDLQRWADYLPFAAVGFHFTGTVNSTPIASGVTSVIIFNNTVVNKEGWNAPRDVRVPKGLSGLYILQAQVYYAASIDTQLSIRRTRGSVLTPLAGIRQNLDRPIVLALDLLQEGDVLDVSLQNISATTITPTTYPGDTINPPYPYFKGYRLALL